MRLREAPFFSRKVHQPNGCVWWCYILAIVNGWLRLTHVGESSPPINCFCLFYLYILTVTIYSPHYLQFYLILLCFTDCWWSQLGQGGSSRNAVLSVDSTWIKFYWIPLDLTNLVQEQEYQCNTTGVQIGQGCLWYWRCGSVVTPFYIRRDPSEWQLCMVVLRVAPGLTRSAFLWMGSGSSLFIHFLWICDVPQSLLNLLHFVLAVCFWVWFRHCYCGWFVFKDFFIFFFLLVSSYFLYSVACSFWGLLSSPWSGSWVLLLLLWGHSDWVK